MEDRPSFLDYISMHQNVICFLIVEISVPCPVIIQCGLYGCVPLTVCMINEKSSVQSIKDDELLSWQNNIATYIFHGSAIKSIVHDSKQSVKNTVSRCNTVSRWIDCYVREY